MASFCPARFRGTKQEVVLGEGQMQMGQEGGHRRSKSQSTKLVFHTHTHPLHEELVIVFSVYPALRFGNPAVLHLAFGRAFMYLV